MMRIHPAALCVVLFVVTASAPGAAGQEAVNLRPQWYEGQQSRYEFWTQRRISNTIAMAGQEQASDVTMTSEGEITWRVDRVKSDGSADCTMTLDWMTLDIADGEGNVQRNDSRKGSGDFERVHDLVRAMAGVPLSVSVAADGRVTAVDGLNRMGSRLSEKDDLPEELDFIESATDLATLAAAPESAEVGDRWSAGFRWTHELGHLEHDTAFTLESVEPIAGVPVAVVNAEADLSLDIDRSKLPADGPSVSIKLADGGYTAQVLYDLSRHEAVGRHSTQRTVIEADMSFRNNRITRRTVETIQNQVLRIAEQ